ncbi:MAG: hypothetical protein IPN38_11290 [Flavobacteriales bacterium]|nr:hypothetical protein [Flavobacteriales bacterium]
MRTKQRTFETAADSRDSWRVVSVSTAALQHIKKNKNARGLQRGHALSRMERAKYLFERTIALTQKELLNYFFEHDTVALVTKGENAKQGSDHWSSLVPVPEGFFTGGSFSIYVRKKKELPWVEQLNLD